MALRLGPTQFLGLAWRKFRKRAGYNRMLRDVPRSNTTAHWRDIVPAFQTQNLSADHAAILAKADAMLRDENCFFTFPYRFRRIDRPWEFDPMERKYWPRRRYSEQALHAEDTPQDVKIVWEINRFKDLPTLGQAAVLTNEKKYAEEAQERMRSWVHENPFAQTINWASSLEISIRLIAWTTTIALLKKAGLLTEVPHEIARSIFEQASYLDNDLSTDKVVPTNHLIGEAAGLYIISSLWEFPKSREFVAGAKRILEREMLRQTFPDGVTREASSWYHQFVTDFCDLAQRVGPLAQDSWSEQFRGRLAGMKAFVNAMTVDGELVRYGDADDGWALWLEGNRAFWIDAIYGPPVTLAVEPPAFFQLPSQVVSARVEASFLFLRAGAFGMGGNGASSHAHDDFLSPIIYLDGRPVLVDPGTFVYNGDRENRTKYRMAEAHNGIIIGSGTGAVQRMNFGWHEVRPDAKILKADFASDAATVTAEYGEWARHSRTIRIKLASAVITDEFKSPSSLPCRWFLHLAPEWKLTEQEFNGYRFQNAGGQSLHLALHGPFDKIEVATYDFSPSYRVQVPATMIQLSAQHPSREYVIRLTIDSAP